MSSDPEIKPRPHRAMMVGAAVGLLVAILLVTYFALHSRKGERDLKPLQAPRTTQR